MDQDYNAKRWAEHKAAIEAGLIPTPEAAHDDLYPACAAVRAKLERVTQVREKWRDLLGRMNHGDAAKTLDAVLQDLGDALSNLPPR